MKKIIDKWTYNNKVFNQKTDYILFNDGHNYDICISRSTHKNGIQTYCMSDSRNEFKVYGTQREIKEIFDELEKKGEIEKC